jgi:ankyrin repeat protein
MAARNQRPDIVKFLVENGANVNARAADGKTPLSWLKKRGIRKWSHCSNNLGQNKKYIRLRIRYFRFIFICKSNSRVYGQIQ